MRADAELSYVHGADTTPLIGRTIGQMLTLAAARWPGRAALIADRRSLTWAELDARAEGLAAGLLALGLRPGERIGIWSLNNVAWALTQFAAAKAGLILVTINPAYREAELEFALNKVGCAALVTATRFKTSDFLGMLGALAPELAGAGPGELRAARLPALRLVLRIGGAASPGTLALDTVPDLGGAAERAMVADLGESLQCDDLANIQFTSGTTGTPKGVTLSHHNILNNAHFVGRAMRLSAEDRICIPVPLYHCFGSVMGNLAAVTSGAAMVYPGEGFDPLATLRAVTDARCTALYGVPTMFLAELDHPDFDGFDLSSLRTGIMAGAPCPVPLMRRAIERMNLSEMTICYGMTETSPVSFQSAVDDPFERRVSTVGRVHPHLEVKIVDAAGRAVPRGQTGELCTRGYSVMRGYWEEPERTAEVLDASGWLHTGDLATLDAEGFCRIVGRIKDMIIRGGENIYPREVEDFLYRHPAVQDVHVFGVPDDRYGEEVCAWVRLRPGAAATAEELRAFCAGRIAHQKVPRHVAFVETFPMTVTGKVQKFLMREAMVRMLRESGVGPSAADRTTPGA
ncbi:AMP-binding protein [Methylobacterium oxalidis]|uniref:3-methylmercaptopropionyl-CoA ligase n=1 Tax=Methylobacterium oxalidis TaxID=944322 RepID=A0A512J7C9_9HYPH|nr:AMP-binding protein [Methylobacterium oxalidis]GJE34417.1 3-[(3aS,4S,7aS)-7a-methyl-1, 5-dioxo-octahydro-1H-inden-4-yl]propanoyl:CoA ligase [Methylobacterium oxalidis]GLS66464.1 AMP-binding protein [Methylobacterium oxalidis]